MNWINFAEIGNSAWRASLKMSANGKVEFHTKLGLIRNYFKFIAEAQRKDALGTPAWFVQKYTVY